MNTLLKFISGIWLITMFYSCNQGSHYSIEGSVNAGNGYVYFQKFRNKMFFVTDSARIENGRFSFRGKVDRPALYGLTTDRSESFQPGLIFLENGKITVQMDTTDSRLIQVKGSASHSLYESYLENRRNFNIDSFIAVHPGSPVAAYILYRDFSTRLSAEELEASLKKFDPDLHDISYLSDLSEVISAKKRLSTGNLAIDFSGISPEGTKIQLSDFRGKYVLLEFWAAWCGPCRRENPNLVRVYDAFQNRGFEILGVSLDRNREDWLKAIEDDRLNWSHISDLKFWDSEPARLYGIRHIPSNVLIDREGKILYRNLKSEDLGKVLENLLLSDE